MSLTITWKGAVGAGAALVVLGVGVAWLGVINIAASTGHWTITDKFLHWSMRNAVRTRSALSIEDSRLDATGLISAAGHYAATCAICHGAPGQRASPVMLAATPPAPDLAVTASEWSDRQLLWIVKHGVKFTPMPAWPTQERNDEVRRMAAFVRRLPEMSPTEYRELAYGSGRMGGVVLTNLKDALPDCERCHADGGRGQPDIPVLAGQKPAYLLAALDEFASGRRAGGVMGAAASRVDRKVMGELAEHYAALPDGLSEDLPTAPPTNTAAVTAARIVARGLREADLPACSKCHAPGKRPRQPNLSGQKPEYLAARLRRWRGEEQAVEARQPTDSMAMIARRIPENMIEPLAKHFAQGTKSTTAPADTEADRTSESATHGSSK